MGSRKRKPNIHAIRRRVAAMGERWRRDLEWLEKTFTFDADDNRSGSEMIRNLATAEAYSRIGGLSDFGVEDMLKSEEKV